jgi:hypothetical protein
MKKFYGLCLILLMLFGCIGSSSAYRNEDTNIFRNNVNSNLVSNVNSNSQDISNSSLDFLNRLGDHFKIAIPSSANGFNSHRKSNIFNSVSDDFTPVVTNQTNKWMYDDDFNRITPDNLKIYGDHDGDYMTPIHGVDCAYFDLVGNNGKEAWDNNDTDVLDLYRKTSGDPTDIAVIGLGPGENLDYINGSECYNLEEFETYISNESLAQPNRWLAVNCTVFWHKYHAYINMNPRVVAVLEAPPFDNHTGSASESRVVITKGFTTTHTTGYSSTNGWSMQAGYASNMCGSGYMYSWSWGESVTNNAESSDSETTTTGYDAFTTNQSTVVLAYDRYCYDYYNHKKTLTHVDGTDLLKQTSVGTSYETVSLDEFNKNHDYYALPEVTDVNSTAGNLSTYDPLDVTKNQYTADTAGQGNSESLTWTFDHKDSETDVDTHTSSFSANFQVGAVLQGMGTYGFCSHATSEAFSNSNTYSTNNFHSSMFRATVKAYSGGEKITWNANFYENKYYGYLVVKYGVKPSGTYYT